jgi:DHHW protein
MKNKIITFSFTGILLFFLILNILFPDKEISFSERRSMTTFPSINIDSILNGNTITEFEKYTLDQFPLRNTFRKFKAFIEFSIMKKLDNNNIFIDENKVFKIEYPLKQKELEGFADKINLLYNKYLKGMNVYYSIIPDKNYYLSDDSHLAIDYKYLIDYLNSNLSHMEYIDITKPLNLESYYNTDLHWRQDKLLPIVDLLSEKMNFKVSTNDYIKKEYYPFYGAYYGQAALNIEPDTLTFLNNSITDSSIVNSYSVSNFTSIYNTNKLGTVDSYDIFLSGAIPYQEIINNKSTNNKELIIFRDSFGSSLAPLLIDGYSKITLIDLRYMSPSLLDNLIEFNNQDILILYSTIVINNSSIIKN